MQVYHVYFALILFVYLLDVCKYTCINLYLQVVVRSELLDKNTIMLAVRIVIQGKYDDILILWC